MHVTELVKYTVGDILVAKIHVYLYCDPPVTLLVYAPPFHQTDPGVRAQGSQQKSMMYCTRVLYCTWMIIIYLVTF